MRRLILTAMFALASNVALAQSLHLAQSPGGVAMTSAGMMKEFLDKKGYNIDLKSLGSCALAKQSWDNATDKFITVWEDGFNSTKNSPCNVAFKDDQIVKVYYQSYLYFCSVPGKDPNLWTTKGATYTVGSGSGLPTAAMMQYIDNKIGSKATPVIYKNSGALATAIAAKEIDYVLVSGGTKKIIEEGGKCFWGTATDRFAVNGIPHVKKTFPEYPFSDVGVSLWLAAKNFSADEMKKFKADINEFIQSEAWLKYLANREIVNVTAMTSEEIKQRLEYNKKMLDNF